MLIIFAADLLVILHLTFICFVVLGGLLVLKYHRLWILHIPAVLWGASLEFFGWFCPLTHWENILRHKAMQAGYSGGFIEHYIIPVIYPSGLTTDIQLIFGFLVVMINVVIYAKLLLILRKLK
ncbi:MAG: DUF2784 family protein [Methylococcaceae bacterium]|nr:DUF2784 family protein [Methylococcaceae bacterium]